MIQPQAVPINFGKGIDQKNDPFQIEMGSFLSLVNTSFAVGRRLTKRNGYGFLSTLPYAASFTTTFNGDLTAVGTNIQAYSSANQSWIPKGNIQPLSLSTLPLIRNNLNQVQSDTAVAPNGLVCTAYAETDGSTTTYKYAVADSVTGQNIVAPTALPSADSAADPKVFVLGSYFVVVYTVTVSAVNHLVFIAISLTNPASVSSIVTVSTNFSESSTGDFDGVVFSNNLYLSWNGASSSGIKMAFVSAILAVSATFTVDASHSATLMTVCADTQNSTIWATYYDLSTTAGYTVAVNHNVSVISGFPVQVISSGTILNLASAAQSGTMSLFYEVSNSASGIQTNYVAGVTVSQASASVVTTSTIIRSLGLASKAFIVDGVVYFMGIYSTSFQPTYFLVNGSISISTNPVVVAKLAYENGGTYLTKGLPSVSVSGSTAQVSYLYKDLIEALSDANDAGTVTTGGIYSQTGINLASFTFGSEELVSAEIGNNLNITGGVLTAYDGYLPVEQGFHLWPDTVVLSPNSTGGHLAADTYFYQAIYEWSDNQGNIFRSAGSVPVSTTTTGTTSSVNVVVPALRVTAKVQNPVKICVYRWSTTYPSFFQVTSIASPVINDPTVDTIPFIDTVLNPTGNELLYTTGGVIEDIGPPAFDSVFIFDDRLWGIDSEDKNLLWFSKQIIEGTPVEMSDLLTIYVAPSIGAQGPTGPLRCGAAMDDKLILFKGSGDGGAGIYYINGSGPDNTGANNEYSQPTFITSMVGCSNQRSIVFQPGGLMFEFASEAGNQIWLLGRDLSTTFIGKDIQELTRNTTVLSSISVPGTNEVRFNMSSGITLKYDYFWGQWGIHTTNAVSSTLYQGLHTYISPNGMVFQETPGKYLDGSTPVLLSFLTGWIQLSGISGYQRIWEIQLLGQYHSPHLLNIQMGYDFAPLSEYAIISPTNYTGPYGSDSLYGQGSPYGGAGIIEQWRIQPATETCQAFQLSLTEVYDPSFGVTAGEGFTLSAFTCLIGVQRGYRPVKATNTVGTS